MGRRHALLGVLVLAVAFVVVLSGGPSDPGSTTLAPTLSLAAEDTTVTTAVPTPAPPATASEAEVRRVLAEQVVEGYWRYLSGDATGVSEILALPPAPLMWEVGLAEYSAAYGGRYVADCTAGVIVEDEVVVDCLVEVLDEPLAEAFEIGATSTQFRVRDDKITQVGYLKPYSTVDLTLSAYAARVDEAGFSAACSDPEGLYQSEAGVVYSGACGAYLAGLVADLLAEVQRVEACGEDCDAALLSAIRPARD